MPRPLHWLQRTQYPLTERLCGLDSRSGPFGVYQSKTYVDDLATEFPNFNPYPANVENMVSS